MDRRRNIHWLWSFNRRRRKESKNGPWTNGRVFWTQRGSNLSGDHTVTPVDPRSSKPINRNWPWWKLLNDPKFHLPFLNPCTVAVDSSTHNSIHVPFSDIYFPVFDSPFAVRSPYHCTTACLAYIDSAFLSFQRSTLPLVSVWTSNVSPGRQLFPTSFPTDSPNLSLWWYKPLPCWHERWHDFLILFSNERSVCAVDENGQN